MKKMFSMVLLISLLFVGCSMEDIVEQNGVPALKFKSVTISADMDSDESRASLDSQTGAFAWQSGDVISALATDGKFYDLTLTSEAGSKIGEFVGQIPETAFLTTVATYPSLVANGADNTIYADGVLNYTLPAKWTYVQNTCNVPMVAAFEQGAEHMRFKQVGAVMRFPVKNLPTEAKFTLTVNGSGIVGPFSVDVATLGESYMAAGESTSSSVTFNYSSTTDGAAAVFNIPVPVGVYNDFTVTVTDGADHELFTKQYKPSNNEVSRATLLVMKDIVLPERPMVFSEIWPYFVDARVLFAKHEGVSQYALYIDGSENPVIVSPEQREDGRLSVLIGGDFEHDSNHIVAVAKVVDGEVVAASKSEEEVFTTGRVMQMTYNTGTKFICAGWDDVAIGVENSTVYNEQTKQWSLVPKNDAVSGRNMRGYRIQLYAEDKTTLLYDEVPFSSQVDYGGAISNSSWIGMIDGENVLLPSALTLGWLEPGKKYYFRVQTLAEPVVFDSPETGCFEPNTAGYTVYSTRGGCGWSNLVEMTTDAPHVASENEVFYEGFDDMMFNSDIMNVASAAVPEFLTEETTKKNYTSRNSAALYKNWVAKPFAERKFSEQGFNTMLGAYFLGITDEAVIASTPRYLNSYAGSLEGWSIVRGKKEERTVNPNFGSVRLGQTGTAAGKIELRTAPIKSDKLSDTSVTKCIVKAKVSAHATTHELINRIIGIYHYRPNGEELLVLDNKTQIDFSLNSDGSVNSDWSANYSFTDASNYKNYPTWFEVTTEVNLQNGDILGFEKVNYSDQYGGCITVGEITIEIAPEGEFEDNGIGTEPDDTNYDVYGLGEFPISYWYTVEPYFYSDNGVYNHEKAVARYQEVKDAGFNIEIYWSHHTPTDLASNKRIHDVCEQVGLKFIGNVAGGYTADRIQAIKDTFGSSSTYVGELVRDEPGADEYDDIAEFVKAYNAALPDKEAYINLFPIYAKTAGQLNADSYETYLDQYLEKIPTKSLSYDFYGLTSAVGEINLRYYENLDMVRSKTLAKKMPFWVITQACDVKPGHRYPTEAEQRWSVWSNIALGSKGIAYFCYGTPTGSDWVSILDLEGNKTQMYDYVQRINKDINTVGKKLLPCHADGAILSRISFHFLWENSGYCRTKYGPIQSVGSGPNGYQVLCGCFRDARISENKGGYAGYKALVMSQIPGRIVQGLLNLDPAVTKVTLTHNNTSEEVELISGLSVKVGSIDVSYTGSQLALTVPDGEAVLVEF